MDPVEVTEINQQVSPIVRKAQEMSIHTGPEMETAKSLIKSLRELKKKMGETFTPMIEKAFAAHKEAKAQAKKHTDPLDDAERILKQKIGDYLDAEEKRLLKEAEDKAQKERAAKDALLKRAEKKVENILEQTTDKQKQLEVLRVVLDNKNTTDEETEIIQAKIEVLEEQIRTGQEKVSDVKEKVDDPVTTPVIPKTVEKSKGLSSNIVKIPTVVDGMALIKAVAEGTAPIGVVKFDLVQIKRIVNAGVTLPGVAVENKRDTRIRS